jgi:hypothetical protein
MRESVEIHYSAIIGSFLSGGPMLKNKGWPWIPSRCIRRRLGLREHRMQPAREKGCEHVFDLIRRRTPPIFVLIYAHIRTGIMQVTHWKCVFCCEWQPDARDAFGGIYFCCTIQTHMSAHRSDQMHTPVALTHFFAAPTILCGTHYYIFDLSVQAWLVMLKSKCVKPKFCSRWISH